MIREASRRLDDYASEIVTIYEKMPEFQYTHFCFYAYDSARLFEHMLGVDPKAYTSFTLDAPDAFFYSLYGGMAGLYDRAVQKFDNSRYQQMVSNGMGRPMMKVRSSPGA